jgi:hypothetical protein
VEAKGSNATGTATVNLTNSAIFNPPRTCDLHVEFKYVEREGKWHFVTASAASSQSQGEQQRPALPQPTARIVELAGLRAGTSITMSLLHPGLVERDGTTGLSTAFPEPCESDDNDFGSRAGHKLVLHGVPNAAAAELANGDAAGADTGSWSCFDTTFAIVGVRRDGLRTIINGQYKAHVRRGSRKFDPEVTF